MRAAVMVLTLTLLGVGPLACARPGGTSVGTQPTAYPSAAPTPSPVTPVEPLLQRCANPAVAGGHGIPDSSGAAMAYDEIDGYPLLVNSTVSTSTEGVGTANWKWDGVGWAPLHPAHCPLGSFVFHRRLGMMFMVGEASWGWDGKDWRWLPPVGDSPSGWGGEMAYDAARDNLVLLLKDFQGNMATWIFDGQRWTRAATSTAPAVRNRAGMAYDPRTRTVLFQGGVVPGGSDPVNETWSWDGSSWRQLDPVSAPGGGFSVLAYDAGAGQMILLQDQWVCPRACVDSVSTWSWDGTNWTKLHPTSQPRTWAYTSLVYDAMHGYLITTTDAAQGATGSETWVWTEGDWKRVV